jgi:hypothetical protein
MVMIRVTLTFMVMIRVTVIDMSWVTAMVMIKLQSWSLSRSQVCSRL